MVTLENLTVSYRKHPALHHLSGQFSAGSLTAVVGPNGSGKSTLLKSIAGLLPLSSGDIKVSSDDNRIAYLPQMADIDRSFPISVQDCVTLGCWPQQGAWRDIDDIRLARVDAALHGVGLEGFEDRPIGSLSSGQLQRVMFARLMVQDADLILLDEPFTALDSKTTAALLQTIAQWHQESRTVTTVLHEQDLIRRHFPQTLLLARELVAWGPTAQVMTEHNLVRAGGMAEAWDENAEICRSHARGRNKRWRDTLVKDI